MKKCRSIEFFENVRGVEAIASLMCHGDLKNDIPIRNRFFEEYFLSKHPGAKLVMAKIAHSDRIKIVESTDNSIVMERDGLITAEKGVFIAVTFADCYPVFFFDPVAKVCGITHCSWMSLKDGIIENVLTTMRNIGCRPDHVRSAIGPGICSNHYEFKDAAEHFFDYLEAIDYPAGENSIPHLDLQFIIRSKISSFGVPIENIETSDLCTFDSEDKYGNHLFFSARREKFPPGKVKTNLAVIGMV